MTKTHLRQAHIISRSTQMTSGSESGSQTTWKISKSSIAQGPFGDSCRYCYAVFPDEEFATVVGGFNLTENGPGAACRSELVLFLKTSASASPKVALSKAGEITRLEEHGGPGARGAHTHGTHNLYGLNGLFPCVVNVWSCRRFRLKYSCSLMLYRGRSG